MFYIRENRLWIRIAKGRVLLAMTSNRKNQELDHEFAEHVQALKALAKEEQYV
jgi:cytochrome c biogenesis protein